MHEFLKEFPNKKWSHAGKKIEKFGCVEHLAGSGRPLSTHNAVNIESVCAQSRRLATQPSFCQTDSMEAHISHSSVHNIIKKDLQIGLNFVF